MSTNNIKEDISKNLGALSGISKKSSEGITSNQESTADKISNKFEELKKNAKKKNLKNVTFGLYEYQNEDLKKLSKKYGINKNELMRETLDIILDLLEETQSK